ncbi:MAG: hypothetical protein RPR40_10015 [Bermanella sp.]
MSILKVIALPLVIFGAYSGYLFYQSHLENIAFDERIQGMSEYEVCQVAFEEFSLDTVKEIGCLDKVEAITDNGE